MQVFFDRREELAPAIWQYYFRPEEAINYVAGQYADFRLSGVTDDPRGPGRVFTLTSLPGDELVSFVCRHDEPASLYKRALRALKPGDEVNIGDVMGDLVLPKLSSVPLVFAAGGIGIASFVGMLNSLLIAGEQREITLFYVLRQRKDEIFKDILDRYQFTDFKLVTAPDTLTVDQIRDRVSPDSLIYLSGSQRFVEGLRSGLQQLGYGHEQIVFDYFDGYAEL